MDIDVAEFWLGRSVVGNVATSVAAVATLANISGSDVVLLSVSASTFVVGWHGGAAANGYVTPGRTVSRNNRRSEGDGPNIVSLGIGFIVVRWSAGGRREGTAKLFLLVGNESHSPNGRPGNSLVHHGSSIGCSVLEQIMETLVVVCFLICKRIRF